MYKELMALFKCSKAFHSQFTEENYPRIGPELGKVLGQMWHDGTESSEFSCELSWECPIHILNWFVNNIEFNFYDVLYLTDISKEQLVSLLNTCEKILFNGILKDGSIDIELCKQLMPIAIDDVFFKDFYYDLDYIHIIKSTADGLRKILKNTDFDNEVILLFLFIPTLTYVPKQFCDNRTHTGRYDESYYDPYDIENHLGKL